MNAHIYSRGENLFDAATNNVTTGNYIDSNGGIATSAPLYVGPDTFNYTDYIPIEAGKTYKRTWHGPAFTTAHGMSVAWYKSTKTFISRTNGSTTQVGATDVVDTFTAPADAAYARINFCSETWPNPNVTMQFYDTAVKWRDYTPNIYAHGANLFDDVATNKVTAGKYIDSAGVEQNNNLPGTSTLNHTSYMPVTGGTEYTYKWHGPTISTSGMIVAIIWYTSNKDFIGRTTKTLQAVTDFTLQGSGPPNAAYAIVNFPSETWPNADVSLEFYETTIKWRETTVHEYSSGSWTK